jgi:hypothetical protein
MEYVLDTSESDQENVLVEQRLKKIVSYGTHELRILLGAI